MHTSDITQAFFGKSQAEYGHIGVIKVGVVGVHAVIIIRVEVGERFTDARFQYAYKKHVPQSNDGTYLAIPHLDLGGNGVVHKFDSIKGSHSWVQLQPHGSVSAPTEAFFLFYTACHNQNIVQRKMEFCISSYFHQTLPI